MTVPTHREIEVLALMVKGYSNLEITDALGTSESTINNYASNVLSKFGVRDRVQAVFKGVEIGEL